MQRNTPTRQENLELPRSSAMAYTLRALTRVAARWPKFTMALVILFSVACVGYSFFFLKFRPERTALFDPKSEIQSQWTNYANSFPQASDVVVVVEAPTVEEIKRTLDDVADRLKREPEFFSHVLYKYEAGSLQRKWLQYLNPVQLNLGLRQIQEYQPVLQGDWTRIELANLFTHLTNQIESRMESAAASGKPASPAEMKRTFHQADLLTTSLDRFLANSNDFRSPWPKLVPTDPQTGSLREPVVYFLGDRGTLGYLHVVPRQDPAEAAGEWRSLKRLEEIDAEVAEAHPETKIGLTGIPVIEHDTLRRSQVDLGLALLLGAAGCLGLMVVGFRGLRHPMLTLAVLAVGIAWTFGFTTVMVEHFNSFSIVVLSILFGLGIGFAVSYTSRYLQLRREGWQLRPALLEATGSTGTSNITTALTAAIALLLSLLTDFVGIAELGIIAAAGIVLCALAVVVVLPALIALVDRDAEAARMPKPLEGTWLRKGLARFPLVTLGVSTAIVLGLGTQVFKIEHRQIVSRVRFDSDLLDRQAQGANSVRLQGRLEDESCDPLLYAVSIANSERQMRELDAKLESLPGVAHVESLALRLPTAQTGATRQFLAQYRAQLSALPGQVPSLRQESPTAVGKAIENFYFRIKGYADNEFAQRIAETADSFLGKFEKLPFDQQSRLMNQYQYRIADDLLRHFYAVRYAAADERIQSNDLPDELLSRYVSNPDSEGKRKWLLRIFPKEKSWDEASLGRFIGELRSVDSNVTGTPVQSFESVRHLRQSYETAALYALAIVWVLLLIDFLDSEARWLTLLPALLLTVLAGVMLHARHIPVDPMLFAVSYVVMTAAIGAVLDARNLRNAALAGLVPLAGGLLMFGLFAVAHVELHPTSLFALPLVLAVGIHYGVQVMHDYRNQGQKGPYQISSSLFSNLSLASLSSIVGFGSLMIASHRGLFGLGLVLAIGIASCLFTSLVMLPSLLTVIAKHPSTASGKGESAGKRTDGERKARAA